MGRADFPSWLLSLLLVLLASISLHAQPKASIIQDIKWFEIGPGINFLPVFSNNSKLLAVCNVDNPDAGLGGQYNIYDSESGKLQVSYRSDLCSRVLFAPDNLHAVILQKGAFQLVRVDTTSVELNVSLLDGPFVKFDSDVSMSPDGRYLSCTRNLISGPWSNYHADTVKIFDLKQGVLYQEYVATSDPSVIDVAVQMTQYDPIHDKLWMFISGKFRTGPFSSEERRGWYYRSLMTDDTLHAFGNFPLTFDLLNARILYTDTTDYRGVKLLNLNTWQVDAILPSVHDRSLGNNVYPIPYGLSQGSTVALVKNSINEQNQWYELWSTSKAQCTDTLIFIPYGRNAGADFAVLSESGRYFVLVAQKYLYLYVLEPDASTMAEMESVSEVNIYPNPTNKLINVQFQTTVSETPTVEVVSSSTGKSFSVTSSYIPERSQIQIDLSQLPTGTYSLLIRTTSRTLTHKVVVLR